MDYAASEADIFVTCTGNVNVITHNHMARMKANAIVCNIGHFDSEIDVASLRQYEWETSSPGRPHNLPRRQADHPPRGGAVS